MLVSEPKPQLVCWVRGWSGLVCWVCVWSGLVWCVGYVGGLVWCDQLFRDTILGGRLASCLGTLVLDSWECWFWTAGKAGSGQLQCMRAFVPTQSTSPQDHA